MRERIDKLVGPAAKNGWIGTFHAICARILRSDGEAIGLSRNFVVFDDGDKLTLIKECLKELDADPEVYKPRAVLSEISHAKEELLGPTEYERQATGGISKRSSRGSTPLYQKKLWSNKAPGLRRPDIGNGQPLPQPSGKSWITTSTASSR